MSKCTNSDCIRSAYVCYNLNTRIKRNTNSNVSVFTAECVALNDGLDLAISHKNKNFAIFCDCQSTLQYLASIKTGLPQNSDSQNPDTHNPDSQNPDTHN